MKESKELRYYVLDDSSVYLRLTKAEADLLTVTERSYVDKIEISEIGENAVPVEALKDGLTYGIFMGYYGDLPDELKDEVNGGK